jgi:hypothetical protein
MHVCLRSSLSLSLCLSAPLSPSIQVVFRHEEEEETKNGKAYCGKEREREREKMSRIYRETRREHGDFESEGFLVRMHTSIILAFVVAVFLLMCFPISSESKNKSKTNKRRKQCEAN